MDRIRYLTPEGGSVKAFVHVAPDRAFQFECYEQEPEPDGCFRILASDPSRGVWHQAVKVRATHRMGALGRVAEAAVRAWDELGGAPWPKDHSKIGPEPIEPGKVLLTGA